MDSADLTFFQAIWERPYGRVNIDLTIDIHFEPNAMDFLLKICREMPNITRVNLSVNNIEFNPYWSIMTKFLQMKTLHTFEVHLLNEISLEDEKMSLIESKVRRIKIFNKILSQASPPWSLVDAPHLESVEIVGCTAGFAATKGRVSAQKLKV